MLTLRTILAALCRGCVHCARDHANDDGPRFAKIRDNYERASDPEKLDGIAHAQFLFETDQGERVMREIVTFLSAPES